MTAHLVFASGLALASLLGCNPHHGGPLPTAKCRTHEDCGRSGGMCRSGRCKLDGAAEGKLTFARPSTASWRGLRLAAAKSARGRSGRRGLLDASELFGRQTRRDARFRFRIEGLPRGLLRLVALCAGGGRVAGETDVAIGTAGHAYVLGSRSAQVPLFVDRARCKRASFR